ncbi:MAG: polysaccharide pyruvyl transferase family protein [Oscillospiraceae bacterium]|jgi:polysaccharide pyruvyl transferase WcaK-like protein|nr:polysaccharide pyruvyl transferase family protein [Oscillospiraceae bacterium]
MTNHFLLYGHGGSYNHGAEAITRCTIELLRKLSPGCRINLSTHFAAQDREFSLPADEFIERDLSGKTNAEIYAPTIERIKPGSVCFHVGGDNYCYKNWQRWSTIHYAALERGAYSILWSCSIDPEVIDNEMLVALKTHHLITARESITYNALLERGCTNIIKVSDIAFALEPEKVDIGINNYVALNVSPLVVRKKPLVLDAFRALAEYILAETSYNIALVPHVVQPADNDFDALRELSIGDVTRVTLVSDKLSAAQYKYVISKARACISARTHAAIAAYSSGVPTLAVAYSAKAHGIAKEVGLPVIDLAEITDANSLIEHLRRLLP